MKISGKAKIAGVIGYPVEQSKSPIIHNYWLDKYNLDGVYIPLLVKPSDFDNVIRALPKMGFVGVNITIPHKMRAMEIVDTVSEEARKTEAVNTIAFTENGRLEGHNTDVFGFIYNLDSNCSEPVYKSGPAVVYGAGGAARAVCYALAMQGCPEIRLVNRTIEKASAIAEKISNRIKIIPFEQRSECLESATLVVNATSLGMNKTEELPIELDKLNPKAVVTDIVYTPLKTALLRRAAARGNKVVDGLGMLIYQAIPAFKVWFGVEPEMTPELRELILK